MGGNSQRSYAGCMSMIPLRRTSAHTSQLVPPAGTDLRTHLRSLIQNELSVPKFEECMIAFLDGLLRDQSIPILAQVEMGQVDGLSREQARVLQQAIGII